MSGPRMRQAVVRLALAIAISIAAGCQGPPHLTNRCVVDWPSTPDTARAALSGVTPGVMKWQTPVTGGTATDGILVTANRVAFAAGGRLYLLDHAGAVVGGRTSAAFERISAPVADAAGNFYFAGASAYSVDENGVWRWIVPLDETLPVAGRSLLMGPTGVLYTTASDGYLYAFDSADGARVWRREVGKNVAAPAVLLGGVGNAVLVITRGETPSSRLYDATSGEFVADFDGPRYGVLFGPTIGVVTQRPEDTTGPYPWMHIAALDPCSRVKWSHAPTRPQWPVLLMPGDDLLVAERDDVEGSPIFVSRLAPDGTTRAGPAVAATPWVVGADGTIYGLACDTSGVDGPSRLIAYDANLNERWRLELGASCPNTTPVIADDGTLYFARFVGSVTELVAVQTDSPGMAAASWPSRRHDVRGTGWLK